MCVKKEWHPATKPLKNFSYILRISKTLYLSQSYVCTNHVSLRYYIYILKNMLNLLSQLAFILWVGNVLDAYMV